MSGSFRNRTGVAAKIAASQTDWRKGYELGLTGKRAAVPDATYLKGASLSFLDGFRCGRDKRDGVVHIIPPAPPRMSLEEEERAQRERARYLARRDPDIPESVLVKCHPAFREEYNKILDWENHLNMYIED